MFLAGVWHEPNLCGWRQARHAQRAILYAKCAKDGMGAVSALQPVAASRQKLKHQKNVFLN